MFGVLAEASTKSKASYQLALLDCETVNLCAHGKSHNMAEEYKGVGL